MEQPNLPDSPRKMYLSPFFWKEDVVTEPRDLTLVWDGLCNSARCSAHHHRRRCAEHAPTIERELSEFCNLGVPETTQELTVREMRFASMTSGWRVLE
jgi:hypothetical protein